MPEFRRLTYKTLDGAWGINGVSLLTCPARLYGAAAKLCDMESLCEDVYRAKDAELTLDALQERTRWVPVEERLPEISNSWGYRILSCASLAILPDTHRRIRDCVYIWRTEGGRATGRLCGSRTGCRCRNRRRRWSDGTADIPR